MTTPKEDTKDEQSKQLLRKLPPSHGIPLGPSKQVEVTLPANLAVVLTQMAASAAFREFGAPTREPTAA